MKFRRSHALVAGVALLGMAVAAPALAGVGQASDPGRQPPAGTSVEKKSDFRAGSQPKAGVKVSKSTDFRTGTQLANRNPQPPSPAPEIRDDDRGAKNLRATKDRGTKGLPPSRDHGGR